MLGRYYRNDDGKGGKIKLILVLVLSFTAVYFSAAFLVPRLNLLSDMAVLIMGKDNTEETILEKVSDEDYGVSSEGEKTIARHFDERVQPEEQEAMEAESDAVGDGIFIDKKMQVHEVDLAEDKHSAQRPLVSIIVNDGGFRLDYAKRAATLSLPLTWAIIPYQPCSKKMLELAKEKEIPALLHLPMQAITDRDASQYIIGKGMSAGEVRKKTADALASLSGVIGVNNHRGSMSTADDSLMSPFLDELKERSLIFVDSRTIGSSVAYAAARKKGVPALKNGGFIDNVSDKKAIETAFANVLPAAKKKGHLVIICHFRPATLLFLEELDKKYENLPARFVTVPEMIELLDAQGGGEKK